MIVCCACSASQIINFGMYNPQLVEYHHPDFGLIDIALLSTTGTAPIGFFGKRLYTLNNVFRLHPQQESVNKDNLILFHGTPAANVQPILRDGFKFMDRAHGRLQGDGIYFSPSMCVSAVFSLPRQEPDNILYIFGCEIDYNCNDIVVVEKEEDRARMNDSSHVVTKYCGKYGGHESSIDKDTRDNVFNIGPFEHRQCYPKTCFKLTEYVVKDLSVIKPRYLIQLIVQTES